MLILLIATLQRDLQSSNYLEITAALHTISRIANNQILLAVSDQVIQLLSNSNDYVRKKAVMVLHKFWHMNNAAIENIDVLMKGALCDKCPAVMGASLNFFIERVKQNPAPYKDLTQSFVVILKQIIEHKLQKDYDYKNIPAPWI
jgi:AP-4 complex subunit epsilon-1